MRKFAEGLGKNYTPRPKTIELSDDEKYVQRWLDIIHESAKQASYHNRRLHGYWCLPEDSEYHSGSFRETEFENQKWFMLIKSAQTQKEYAHAIRQDRFGNYYTIEHAIEKNKLDSYVRSITAELIKDGFKNPIFRAEFTTVEIESGSRSWLTDKPKYVKYPAFVFYLDISW